MKISKNFVTILLVCSICIAVCKKPDNDIPQTITNSKMVQMLDTPVRYKDSIFAYSQIDIATNITYRDSSTDYEQGDTLKKWLKLDFYEPRQSLDPVTARPLIIWIHGGGFEGGDKADVADVRTCMRFASRGFTVASINYRLRPGMCAVRETVTLEQLVVEIYRAVQDARYAVRYIKSRASEGRIDTNYIFAAGLSAGAVTALHLAYLDQDELALSPYINTAILGTLDFGELFNTNAKVKAIMVFSGSIYDINWVEAGDIPAICLHSDKDNQLPVDEGLDSIYHEFYTYSGIRVSQRLTALGIQSDFLRFDEGQTPPLFTCGTATHGGVEDPTGARGVLTDSSINFAFTTLYNFYGQSP